MSKFLSRSSVIVGLVVLYRILLDYIYLSVTSVTWDYYGFIINAGRSSFWVSWMVLLALLYLVFPFFQKEAPFYPDILILVFIMRVVPFTTLLRFQDIPGRLTLLFFVFYALLFILAQVLKFKKIPLLRGGKKQTDLLLYLSAFFFIAIVVFISGFYAKFRLHFSLTDVYDLRQEAREFDIPTILKYLWAPATNVLPLVFVYFAHKRKVVVCLLIFAAILLNFSINGMKSTFFKLLICVAFGFVNIKNFKSYYLPGFVVLLVFTLAEGLLWDLHLLHDILVRRALLVPPLLDTYYYDYITQEGPLFYVRGEMRIQNIIGEVYFNDPETACNNGLFSDAYMNLGALGCIVYPVIYAFIFRICGSAFRGAEKGLVVFAALIMSYTFEGSELTTGLLTHGLFVFGIIMYLVSSKGCQNEVGRKKKKKVVNTRAGSLIVQDVRN